MSESESVRQGTAALVTSSELAGDLRALGLGADERPVIVHTAMSALGWVCGGAQAVIESLLAAAGPSGTIVMPAFSAGLTDPSHWTNPPVPEEWWQPIRDSMPAYDPARTPTRAIGVVAELFRTWPGVVRSAHPHASFAAHGPQAADLLAHHPVEGEMDAGTAFASLYDADARILLLGATHASNSSLHLSEYRATWRGKRTIQDGAPMIVNGRRAWVAFETVDYDSDDFARIGADFGERATAGKAGRGTARIMSMRALVVFGVAWMERHRPESLL